MDDPVERQTQEMIGRIPDVLANSPRSLSIRQIAQALSHHTNAPWTVVFAVERLEQRGVIRRDMTRGNRAPWRWTLI